MTKQTNLQKLITEIQTHKNKSKRIEKTLTAIQDIATATGETNVEIVGLLESAKLILSSCWAKR